MFEAGEIESVEGLEKYSERFVLGFEGGSGISTKRMERRMAPVVEHISHQRQHVWGNRQALSLAEIQGLNGATMGKESAEMCLNHILEDLDSHRWHIYLGPMTRTGHSKL